jgi:septal ring factor EnvC (AmiA/AmiB activator)
LSSKDLLLIATWEEMGIPLSAVLEGLERAFAGQRRQRLARSKVQALSFCDTQVLKAFQEYKARKVGREKKMESREEKKNRVQAEVRKFLAKLPSEIAYLRKHFDEVAEMLSRSELNENALEKKEKEIEAALLENCPFEERKRLTEEIQARYKPADSAELSRILEIKLLKAIRDKHRIPYLSFYYY